ncbi:hypothetical protein Glove_421g160 [Diversispora epigaea]|uniref:Uncharacterized protein n=1 Tax=Diversispora epigaea TaxID=1348612 RepID=A0A397GZW1_9GLOM|nr:hypothetical protein Glove_421g160 [Diversispora epigaea]
MNSIESLHNLTSKFALEYSNRVREIVQQTEINSYPPTFNSQQLEELKQIRAQLHILFNTRDNCLFKFMRAKARNLCVEKAIEIKNETVNEIVDREIAKSEQDPEHESFYTLKDLNRVKDCLDQIEHHKRYRFYQQQQQTPRPSLNTLLPPRSPPLPPHNRIRNTSPEGSNFSQTRPASRSNTPDSTASESSSRSRSITDLDREEDSDAVLSGVFERLAGLVCEKFEPSGGSGGDLGGSKVFKDGRGVCCCCW